MDNNKGLLRGIITRRKVVIVVMLLLFAVGGMNFIQLPKQQYPVIKLPIVLITTTYPGASAEDIEELVTSKIEDKCMEAEGFDNVKSNSYNSISVVQMMFDRDLSDSELQEDMDKLRNEIMALKENELPSGVTQLVYNDSAFDTCGLIVSFTSDTESNEELVQRAESLKDNLTGMYGVSKVEIEGEIERQIKVTADPAKLNHTSLSLAELSQIISYQNSTIPVGTIEFDTDEMYINSSGKLADIDEIRDIIVSVNSDTGAVVKLKDIASVEMSDNSDSKRYTYNGKASVILSLYFKDGINVLEAGKDVMSVIDDYKTTISDDVELNNVIYLPDDVNGSISEFVINLLESVLIVLFVVMVGMSIINGNIVAIVIPLTIFITFTVMRLFGIDIQFVSLASLIIALGMLVDNAIVVSDAIQVRFDEGDDKMTACVQGTKGVALPMLASTMTTVVIFCAFYLLPGTMRRFVFSLPTIVIAALVASYIISISVIPMLCYLMMKPSKEKKEHIRWFKDFFGSLLKLALKFKVVTLLLSIIVVGLSVLLLSRLDMELLPFSDKELLDITITTDNLYDIRKTKNAVSVTEEILNNEKPVEYYLGAAGGRIPKYDFTSMPGTDATNTGSFVVKIDMEKEDGYADKGEYCEYLENKISSKLGSCKVIVKEIGIIPKASEPVQIDICGDDYETLNNVGIQAQEWLEEMDNTKNVYCDKKVKTYDYYINMKNNSLNSSGLTKGEVQNELNIAMMGREASIYRKDSKEYPIMLETNIRDIDTLKDLKVKSSITGGKYKIGQIANVELKESYNSISRYNGKRSVVVTASAKNGKSPVEIQMALQKKIDESGITGVNVVYEGDRDMFNDIVNSLSLGAVLGMFAIIFILYLQFYSIKRCIVVFATVPFSLIGSSIGLTVFGQNLSIFAILGIISLIGVVVNNAIVLVDYTDNELRQGVSVDEACIIATRKRFRPVIMSSCTTMLGLLPLIISQDVLFMCLSIAFICGLAASMLFTLVVIPVIYSILVKEVKVIE